MPNERTPVERMNPIDYIYSVLFEKFTLEISEIVAREQDIAAGTVDVRQIEIMKRNLFGKITESLFADPVFRQLGTPLPSETLILECFEAHYDEMCRFHDAFGHDLESAREQLLRHFKSRQTRLA